MSYKEVRIKVKEVVEEITQIDIVSDDYDLSKLFESIDYVNMVMNVERIFNISFDVKDLKINKLNTIKKVCTIILMKLGELDGKSKVDKTN